MWWRLVVWWGQCDSSSGDESGGSGRSRWHLFWGMIEPAPTNNRIQIRSMTCRKRGRRRSRWGCATAAFLDVAVAACPL